MATTLAKPPFRMEAASAHLIAWLSGSMRQTPCLNDSYCMGPPLAEPTPDLAILGYGEVVDLEPAVASIALTGLGKKRPCPRSEAIAVKGADDVPEEPSKRARFVYSTAVEAMDVHKLSWADALALSEACWDGGGHALPVPADGDIDTWASCDPPDAGYDIIGRA